MRFARIRRRRGNRLATVAGAALLSVVLAACGSSASGAGTGTGGGAGAAPTPAGNDQLAAILARGTLVVSSDPAYPPQSFARENATRTPSSKCAANQLTAGEMDGFDVQTAIAVAAKLGVEVCFVAPQWTEITGGSWGDRWDISIGSMDISRERLTDLLFAQPYYATPSYLFVGADSPYTKVSDLDGKKIGACLDCTQYAYLDGTLDLPGQDTTLAIKKPVIVGYDVEAPGLDDLAAGNGKVDAFLASSSVGQPYIDEGKPVRAIKTPLFYGYSAPALDRRSGRDPTAFLARVNEIVRGLQADGTLTKLSQTYFGADLASQAAAFDLDGLGQTVP